MDQASVEDLNVSLRHGSVHSLLPVDIRSVDHGRLYRSPRHRRVHAMAQRVHSPTLPHPHCRHLVALVNLQPCTLSHPPTNQLIQSDRAHKTGPTIEM